MLYDKIFLRFEKGGAFMDGAYSNLLHICGTVENVVYSNDETGYSICEIKNDNGETTMIVGSMPYISVGERIDVFGSWTHHQLYGRQFKVEKYEKVLPNDKNGIFKYLSSGIIKGIGPKIAQKIVDKYGEDTFEVIANHGDWLMQIRGISLNKAREISKDFRDKTGVRELMIACDGHLSPAMALQIYQKWGREAVKRITEDPYALCEFGFPFNTADQMAKKLGNIYHESNLRIKSGIIFVLKTYSERDGHTYVFKETLATSSQKLLDVDKEKIFVMIDELVKEDKIRIVNFASESHVYLKDTYITEEYIAKKLLFLNKTIFTIDISNIHAFIEQIEYKNSIKYASMQKKSIEKAISNGVTVITGGPGTGKTTVVKALLEIFNKLGLKCALAAPTGRAAKRMSETTSCEAKTIHRLLEMEREYDERLPPLRFGRNEKNHLLQDVIIVDETSMIDIFLMKALLKAIKPGSRLILIGDVNQLPSIGEGDVLNDIIRSERFSTIELKEIFRQDKDSGIISVAHQIKNGIIPDLTKKYDDFFFISKENESQIPSYVADLYKRRLPAKYGEDRTIQVITPTKKGVTGTKNLNLILKDVLNPPSPSKTEYTTSSERVFRVGDKVMQTRNDYCAIWHRGNEEDYGIYNGEIGIIKAINKEEKKITIDFDEKITEYDFSALVEIDPAYAVTVHKSQGSEYSIVIVVLSKTSSFLLTRNLIYTAITRAEDVVIVIGDKKTFENMILNDNEICKNTGLCYFLRNGEDECD